MSEIRNQFTFYRSYYDAIDELPKKDQAALILAICAYALYEKAPEGLSAAASIAFKLIRPTLDSGRKKSKSGSAGGKANAKQTEANDKQNESKTEAKSKQGESAREKEREKEKEKEVEVEVEVEGKAQASGDGKHDLQTLKGTLGKGVVRLTDAQFDALLDKLGYDNFNHYVERLADFILEKGAVVHNHYETILKWYAEDCAV